MYSCRLSSWIIIPAAAGFQAAALIAVAFRAGPAGFNRPGELDHAVGSDLDGSEVAVQQPSQSPQSMRLRKRSTSLLHGLIERVVDEAAA
jgi:hypothetical protein